MTPSLAFQEAFNGLSVASILLLAALGLAFSFGLMKVINMAHGEFMMIGAYTTFVFQKYVAVTIGGPNGAKDGVAGDERVGAGLVRCGDGLSADATIDLEKTLCAVRGKQCARTLDLVF